MSLENVELWRVQIEQLRAGATAPFDHDAAISKMAELWDPEIELDVSEAPALDLGGVHRGIGAVRNGGESGLPPGKPSNSSTSWLMPVTA